MIIPNVVENSLAGVLKAVRDILLGLSQRLTFSDNIQSQLRSGHVSAGSPNTEYPIAHTLGRIPVMFSYYTNDSNSIVYAGPTAWTSTTIYLKCSGTSVSVTILIY